MIYALTRDKGAKTYETGRHNSEQDAENLMQLKMQRYKDYNTTST